MTTPEPPTSPLPALFVPGERLGWVFKDRNLHRRPFTEPPPTPKPIPYDLLEQYENAEKRLRRRLAIAGGVSLGVAGLLSCCGRTSEGLADLSFFGALAFVCGLAVMGVIYLHYRGARAALRRARSGGESGYQRAHADWVARRDQHDEAERARVEGLPEWGAATPGPGRLRVDIVGGNVWGWEALLTVFGGSLLSTRGELTLLDLSGETVCRELVRLAEETGTSASVISLPSQLAEANLLAGLEPRQIVDTLVEAMHGESSGGNRADRALDTRILHALSEALEPNVTVARLAAGLRVLLDEPSRPDLLSNPERRHIAEGLFATEFRRQAYASLRRMESYLHPLEELGTAVRLGRPATLTCLVADPDGRSAQGDLIRDLTIQWLIRRIGSGATVMRSLVIAGADELAHQHVERLTDLCERRDIRLVLLFRHLREQSVRMVGGGGAVGFMRLANHEEARQAAEFIGRQHKFVLSELTRSLGGRETHTVADTEGVAESEGKITGVTTGGVASKRRGQSWSVTRNWSQTVSAAKGTNWSDAAAAARVYEYAVEPRVLQNLPDYALLLVKGADQGSSLEPVEVDPAIVLLPRVSMDPLPDPPAGGTSPGDTSFGGTPLHLPPHAALPNPFAGHPNPFSGEGAPDRPAQQQPGQQQRPPTPPDDLAPPDWL